jgi:hypothetical protein
LLHHDQLRGEAVSPLRRWACPTLYRIYSGDGNRVSQTVDSVETTYILDVATQLTMVLAETISQDSIYYRYGLDRVAQSDGTIIDALAYDGLGLVRCSSIRPSIPMAARDASYFELER